MGLLRRSDSADALTEAESTIDKQAARNGVDEDLRAGADRLRAALSDDE